MIYADRSPLEQHGTRRCVAASIELQARAELQRSAYSDIRRVVCTYHDGVLELHGRVSSFFLKQVAQATVQHRLEGLAQIKNRLEVATALGQRKPA